MQFRMPFECSRWYTCVFVAFAFDAQAHSYMCTYIGLSVARTLHPSFKSFVHFDIRFMQTDKSQEIENGFTLLLFNRHSISWFYIPFAAFSIARWVLFHASSFASLIFICAARYFFHFFSFFFHSFFSQSHYLCRFLILAIFHSFCSHAFSIKHSIGRFCFWFLCCATVFFEQSSWLSSYTALNVVSYALHQM